MRSETLKIPVMPFRFRTFYAPDQRRNDQDKSEHTIDRQITVSMPFVKFGTSEMPIRFVEV